MKVYCGKNHKSVWKASLEREKLAKFDNVFETELPVIHNNKVFMIKTYHGYDYEYGISGYRMYLRDIITISKVFHSVTAAKKSKKWKSTEKLVKENPQNYHVTPLMIASDDCGSPFVYGDIMQDKFRMEIIAVRLI